MSGESWLWNGGFGPLGRQVGSGMAVSRPLGRQVGSGMAVLEALGRQVGPGTAVLVALGRQVGPGTAVLGILGRQVGPGTPLWGPRDVKPALEWRLGRKKTALKTFCRSGILGGILYG